MLTVSIENTLNLDKINVHENSIKKVGNICIATFALSNETKKNKNTFVGRYNIFTLPFGFRPLNATVSLFDAVLPGYEHFVGYCGVYPQQHGGTLWFECKKPLKDIEQVYGQIIYFV